MNNKDFAHGGSFSNLKSPNLAPLDQRMKSGYEIRILIK